MVNFFDRYIGKYIIMTSKGHQVRCVCRIVNIHRAFGDSENIYMRIEALTGKHKGKIDVLPFVEKFIERFYDDFNIAITQV